MPRSVADVVEIVVFPTRAHAFLARRRGDVSTAFEASENILERHHSRIDEHQCRIVMRYQRRRGDTFVSCCGKIVEEGAADIVRGGHKRRLGEASPTLKYRNKFHQRDPHQLAGYSIDCCGSLNHLGPVPVMWKQSSMRTPNLLGV